jgi:hypothetical protein
MSAEARRRELHAEPVDFNDWLIECARRYARSDAAPDFYSFDESINSWLMLHGCGLTPQDALSRMFGTLH